MSVCFRPAIRAAAMALVINLGLPHSSVALEVGDCHSPSEMKKILAKEQQKLVLFMNELIKPRDSGLVLTANKENRTGYILKSDNELGQPTPEFCVDDEYNDVHLNFSKVTPPDLLKGIDPDIAEQECHELVADGSLSKGACIPLTTYLDKVAQNDDRVLLWAKKPGSITIIVEAQVNENGMPVGVGDFIGTGTIAVTNKDGATTLLRTLEGAMTGPDFAAMQRMQSH